MRKLLSGCLLFLCVLAASAHAADVATLVSEIDALVVELQDPDNRSEAKLVELRTKTAALNAELKADKAAPAARKLDAAVRKQAEDTVKSAEKLLNRVETRSVAEAIGSARPMTAVLFSGQDRNEFEVVASPDGGTMGLVHQKQDGTTAGILIAAEAPFAYPKASGRTVECPSGHGSA